MRSRAVALSLLMMPALAAALASPAGATPPPLQTAPSAPQAQASPSASPAPGASPAAGGGGFFNGIERRDTLLDTLGGVRPLLSKYGMTLTASETSEELGNVTGGTRRGFDYEGLLQMDLQLDTQRAFGLHGGTFNVSALQVHGSNLSANNLATLQTASGIEADRATRLWELWYQQDLTKDNRADIKIGQQSLDQEFMVSQNALLFVNTMFGWPLLPSDNLPGGGPAYPLSALGVRLRAHVNDSLTVLGGVFNGSPAAINSGDPQQQNPSGLSFPLNGGQLAIAEVQYTYPGLGALVYPGRAAPLSGTYRLGAWYDSEDFADQTYDTQGVPLASNASNGIPRRHQGNYAVYGVVDQLLAQSSKDPDRTLNFFARVMGTPLQDRNLIAFSSNLGFTLHAPILHRDDDTLGLGVGYGRVSAGAADNDVFAGLAAGRPYPIRSAETFAELTYQAQIYPWLQLQPDFQYVFNPGAGLSNPAAPTQRIGDEAVFGVRAIVAL